jgi:hypothetical protein
MTAPPPAADLAKLKKNQLFALIIGKLSTTAQQVQSINIFAILVESSVTATDVKSLNSLL